MIVSDTTYRKWSSQRLCYHSILLDFRFKFLRIDILCDWYNVQWMWCHAEQDEPVQINIFLCSAMNSMPNNWHTNIYIYIFILNALAIVCICQKFSFFAQCVQKSINIYFIRRNSYSQTFQANKYFNVKCQCNAARQKHRAAAQNATTYRIHTYKVRETKQFPSDITTEKMNSN